MEGEVERPFLLAYVLSMRRFKTLAGAIVLCAGCMSTPPPVHRPAATESAVALVRLDTPTSCRIELDGRSFAVPGDGDGLSDAIAALRDRFERITIDGPEDAPYRCVGGLIYAAQRAGMPIEFARPVLTRAYYVDGSAQIVGGHDANGDGRLSRDEWAAIARAAMAGAEDAENAEEALADVTDSFGRYDLDRDQFISADEFAAQYLHTFDCLDANRDGRLSGEEQRRGIEGRCNPPDPRAAD